MAEGPIGDPVASPPASYDGVVGEREHVWVFRNALSEPPQTTLTVDRRPIDDDLRYMQSGIAIALVRLMELYIVMPGDVPRVLSERRCIAIPLLPMVALAPAC